VHTSMAVVKDDVPVYCFMSLLDGDEHDAPAMEDRFFLQEDVNLSDDEEEVDDFLSQSGDSNPAEYFNLAPLPISGHSTDGQDTIPEYIHHYQVVKFKDINVDTYLHEELMHHIKNTAFLQGCLMIFKNGPKNGLDWATSLNPQKNSNEPNDGQV
jgi:hypothetical protein